MELTTTLYPKGKGMGTPKCSIRSAGQHRIHSYNCRTHDQ